MEQTHLTLSDFWNAVDRARAFGGGEDEIAYHAKRILSEMTPEHILQWGRIYEQYHDAAYVKKLWSAANIMDGGFCSDDGFIDFRAWLISQGRDVYMAALENPDTLAKLPVQSNVRYELVHYAALHAYEKKIRRGMDYYADRANGTLPTLLKKQIQNDVKLPPDANVFYEDICDVKAVFPNLMQKYDDSMEYRNSPPSPKKPKAPER